MSCWKWVTHGIEFKWEGGKAPFRCITVSRPYFSTCKWQCQQSLSFHQSLRVMNIQEAAWERLATSCRSAWPNYLGFSSLSCECGWESVVLLGLGTLRFHLLRLLSLTPCVDATCLHLSFTSPLLSIFKKKVEKWVRKMPPPTSSFLSQQSISPLCCHFQIVTGTL